MRLAACAGAVAPEDAAALVQLFCSAVENLALLQPDNEHALACRDELAAACATVEGAAAGDEARAAAWALHVLLACMQRLSGVISHDSSRCGLAHGTWQHACAMAPVLRCWLVAYMLHVAEVYKMHVRTLHEIKSQGSHSCKSQVHCLDLPQADSVYNLTRCGVVCGQ